MDLSDARWRKSSRSGSDGGHCVEVATNLPGAIAVRDSKDHGGPALVFPPAEWHAFIGHLRIGDDALRLVASDAGDLLGAQRRNATDEAVSAQRHLGILDVVRQHDADRIGHGHDRGFGG
ncbi:DUF397 domain-containing protein [Sphaerisporangium viridialbum]|uniref:DUF397 domain-containing protein n=1 Tax=Sphaerisporangium viridialbum TaxID=46189 RepID=UPI003C7820D4